MKVQTITPSTASYFKHAHRVYKAVYSQGNGCNECCFHDSEDFLTGPCNAPMSINCTGKIIKDVTGSQELKDVELIDTPVEKRSIVPILILLLIFWTLAITLIIT